LLPDAGAKWLVDGPHKKHPEAAELLSRAVLTFLGAALVFAQRARPGAAFDNWVRTRNHDGVGHMDG
jgi:hypothetical protein